MVTCMFCKNTFLPGRNTRAKYCSLSCQGQHTSQQVINDYLSNPIPETFYHKGNQIRKAIRLYFLDLVGFACQKCGWNRKHPNAELPSLEIDHKDGDWQNCVIKNIHVLCPNCHSLTDSYKGRNRGNGRKYRRK